LAQTKENPIYLTFLDGVRGVTSFYVVLYHVVANGQEGLTPENFWLNFLRFGHEAVVIFIVLSGFVLALPVARAPGLGLKGGLQGFFTRRARRILPAYYMALLVLPVFYMLVELLKNFTGEGTDWSRLRELFLSSNMVSHLLLVHILSKEWAYSINPVLWSMGTEWWAYFVFALLLVPIWRRFGVLWAAAASLVLGLLPTLSLALGGPTIYGSPYLVGAFGMGMASAAIVYRPGFQAWYRTRRRMMTVLGLAAFAGFCAVSIGAPSIRLNEATRWVTDLLLAVVCALFILNLGTTKLLDERPSAASRLVTRILETRPLVAVGKFSYSLYLTHLVIWAILGVTLNLAPVRQVISLSLDPMPTRILVLIPVQLLTGYVFYSLFEKPFIRRRP